MRPSKPRTPKAIFAEYEFAHEDDLGFKLETEEETAFDKAISEIAIPKLVQINTLRQTIGCEGWWIDVEIRRLLFEMALGQTDAGEKRKQTLLPQVKELRMAITQLESLLYAD